MEQRLKFFTFSQRTLQEEIKHNIFKNVLYAIHTNLEREIQGKYLQHSQGLQPDLEDR